MVGTCNRHKFTVVSYRGQKQFNVTVMGFKNFPFYVQKKIDVILRVHRQKIRVHRKKIRVYVDDIIVFNHTLEEHVSYLHSIFQLFDSYGINLLFKKSFLNYFTVGLLGQKIDVFGFTTAADKLNAISKLNFFYTFKNLETYLRLTDWLLGFVFWYVQKIETLQRKKKLQSPSNKNTTRNFFSRKTIVENFTSEKFELYRQFQEFFFQVTFLILFFNERIFHIDIDASKRRGFGAMVYHLKITCLNPEKTKAFRYRAHLFFQPDVQ